MSLINDSLVVPEKRRAHVEEGETVFRLKSVLAALKVFGKTLFTQLRRENGQFASFEHAPNWEGQFWSAHIVTVSSFVSAIVSSAPALMQLLRIAHWAISMAAWFAAVPRQVVKQVWSTLHWLAQVIRVDRQLESKRHPAYWVKHL